MSHGSVYSSDTCVVLVYDECDRHLDCIACMNNRTRSNFLHWLFLAQDVIYISRAYAMMAVCLSVCLWRLCTVVTRCDGRRISLHACIDGCLYYLLTTPHPDRRMGWCKDFWWKRGGYGKCGNCSDIACFTYFFNRWTVTTWRNCLHERY